MTASLAWDLIITTLGLTKMAETTMMSGCSLCGKSRVCLKSRLHSVSSVQKCIYFELENLLLLVVIEFIWIPGDPITASKSIPECFALKANVVACWPPHRMVLGGGQMGEGFFSTRAQLQGSCHWRKRCHPLVDVHQADSNRPRIILKKGSKLEDYRSKVPYWSSRAAVVHVWYVIYY